MPCLPKCNKEISNNAILRTKKTVELPASCTFMRQTENIENAKQRNVNNA